MIDRPRRGLPVLLALALLTPAPATAWGAPAPAGDRGAMRVAVLEFASASSDTGLEVLGKGLQSMVTTDLAKVGALRLIERARLNDIVSEQKLGGSGLIDRRTAAKIGALAGASHLLGGTYTVHGAQMRLDARLFSVASGEVLLAAEMTGERDAFFELEKELVKKLVGALGLRLAPKERAQVAKIHTADFEAFKHYASGVAKFDARQYQAAMDELRTATRIDADFNLARVTLGEYEALVTKIRAKADKLELTQRELERLAADAVARDDALVVQRLVEIAGERGDASRPRRLAALTFLLGLYNPKGRNHGRIMRFQDRSDAMIVRGHAASLARRYLVDSRVAFPDAPLFSRGRQPPKTPAEVDARVAKLVVALKQGLERRAEYRDGGLIKNLGQMSGFATLMAADPRERIALYELALDKLAALNAEPRARARLLHELADVYLAVAEVDAASGALARESALLTRPSELQRIAKRVEALGALAKLLHETDKAAALREVISGTRGRLSARQWEAFATRGAPSRALLNALRDARKVTPWQSYADPFWLFGEEPARFIGDAYHLQTGPRRDRLRADRLRYYEHERMTARDTLVWLGHHPRRGVDARFTLSVSPAGDYWPYHTPRDAAGPTDLSLDPARPEVSFVFGLHDLATKAAHDPDTGERTFPRPTQGYAIRLRGPKIELVRLGEHAPAEALRRDVMPVEVLADHGGGSAKRRVKVRVTIDHGEAVVQIDGRRGATFPLPAGAEEGFVGFHLRGRGYVELSGLKLTAP